MTTLFFQLNRFNSSDPWGFRLVGGIDYGSPLTVAQVVQGGQADRAGVEPGDQVTNLGGQPTTHMSHDAAQQAILRCGNTLSLQIFRKDCHSQAPQPGHHQYHHANFSNSAHVHEHNPEKHRSHTQIYINDAGFNSQRSNYSMTPRNDSHNCQHHGPMSPGYSSGTPSHNISNASSFNRGPPFSPSRPHNAPQPMARQVQSSPMSGGGIPRPFTNPVKTYGVTPERAHMLGPTPKSSNASSRPGFPGISAPQPFSSPIKAPPVVAAPAPSTKPGGSMKPRHRKAGEFERRTPSGGTIPMCHFCKTIIRGPFMASLDYCFCPDHFNCIKCNRNLEECGFVENNGELYCEDDYAKFLAPSCSKCNQLILEEVVTALNKTWHPGCFLCVTCSKPLGEGMFRVGDDSQIYCEEDWMDAYQARCDKCQTSIEEIDKVIEYGGLTMHARCFCCSACQISLEGKKFVSKNGKPFCKAHANAAAIF